MQIRSYFCGKVQEHLNSTFSWKNRLGQLFSRPRNIHANLELERKRSVRRYFQKSKMVLTLVTEGVARNLASSAQIHGNGLTPTWSIPSWQAERPRNQLSGASKTKIENDFTILNHLELSFVSHTREKRRCLSSAQKNLFPQRKFH